MDSARLPVTRPVWSIVKMSGSADVHVTAAPSRRLALASYSPARKRIVSPTAARRAWPGVITRRVVAVLPPPPGATPTSLHAAAVPNSMIEQQTNERRQVIEGAGLSAYPAA